MRRMLATAIIILLGVLLAAAVSEMPPFAAPSNPADNQVNERYLGQVVQEVGVLNVISGIITDYRAFDTLGEAAVLFAGIAAVLAVLETHNLDTYRKDRGKNG